MLIHKSLPSLPPNAKALEAASQSPFSPDNESPPSDTYSDTPTELPRISQKRPSTSRSSSQNGMSSEQQQAPLKRPSNSRSDSSQSGHGHRDKSPAAPQDSRKEDLTLPPSKHSNRHSDLSQQPDPLVNGDEFITMALDLNPAPGPSPMVSTPQFDGQSEEKENLRPQGHPPRSGSKDYFNTKGSVSRARKASQEQQHHQMNNQPAFNHKYVSPQPESPPDSSQPSSPHIAYQEIGRELSSDGIEASRKRRDPIGQNNSIASVAHERPRGDSRSRPPNGESRTGKFTLQEVPKGKRSGGSARNSQSDPLLLVDFPTGTASSKSAPPAANTQIQEQHVDVLPSSSPLSLRPEPPMSGSPHAAFDSRSIDNAMTDSSTSHSSPVGSHLQPLPQRGDSLVKSKQANSRKENTSTGAASKLLSSLINAESEDKPLSAPPAIGAQYTSTPSASNGTRNLTKVMDSSEPGSLADIQQPLQRSRERIATTSGALSDSITPSKQPNGNHHKVRNESVSTVKTESTHNGEQPTSPKGLPRYSGGQEFSLHDDMNRIMSSEDHPNHDSFLRRVSNSMRHTRSYSDRGGTRLSKEQKWSRSPPTVSPGVGQDFGSPTTSSPESKEELGFLRTELRRERQKTLEKEQKILELEAALEAKNSITEMNTELREKRSTMVVLDTQKEIVVRELEVLTEHIAESKKSREPLDLGKMSNVVLREFAESLQKLKESFAPQIEDLTQKRIELLEEVKSIEVLKDRSLLDFEKISEKNAELTEINNQILQQIQEIYKANAAPHSDLAHSNANGLGIRHYLKDLSSASLDSRELRPSVAESNATGSTLVHEHDSEIQPATQVVNIRKGQPKKFWKRGGQNVAKGVTKGLKGAFLLNEERKLQRDGQYTEGLPYSQMAQSANYPMTDPPPKNHHHDPSRQGFSFFERQKGKPQRSTPNGSMPAVNLTAGANLFGSELEHRAEYEGGGIPGIVMRCIEEVELRGMDVEGIYRKSGGNSQTQQIKEGFERTNDYDISDPDLDIHAVTSTLKQYLRKLPIPLVTYIVYDKLLKSAPPLAQAHAAGAPPPNPNHNLDPEQREQRVDSMRKAVNELPPLHRTCLEVLVFHLARVVEREKENLMTSWNVAVVFAPTIMRPDDIAREMSENLAKSQAVQFLIENCQGVFLKNNTE
ncbi:MAG: hypothetical protein Q9167_007581 [Letrouitia subvulpina]